MACLCVLRFSLQLNPSAIRHPNSPTLHTGKIQICCERAGRSAPSFYLASCFIFVLFLCQSPSSPPCMFLHRHASSASCLPYQAINANEGCWGIRSSACFGNCQKLACQDLERRLETSAPACVGSARLSPLCCKVNRHCKHFEEHFVNGASSFSKSSVCSENPSHEYFHGRGQLWLVFSNLGIFLQCLK